MENYTTEIKDYIVLANKMEWNHFSECSVSDKWLIVIFQTSCEISYNGKDYFIVPANSTVIYAPHTIHAFRKNDGNFLNTFMYFNTEEELFNRFSFPLNKVFNMSEDFTNLIIRSIDEISYIINTPFDLNKKKHIGKMIERTLNMINSAYKETVNNNNADTLLIQIFSDIRRKMFENPVDYNVKKMVEMSNFSSVYFGIKYKEFFGITPSQDRKKPLIAVIRNYLRTTNYSLEKIAELCKLQSVSYLIRLFKQEEKITPCQYRRTELKKVKNLQKTFNKTNSDKK